MTEQCRSIERHRVMSGYVRCQMEAGPHVWHAAIEDGVIWRWDGAGGRAAQVVCGDELGPAYPGIVCVSRPRHVDSHMHFARYHRFAQPGDWVETHRWTRRWARADDPGVVELWTYDGRDWRPVPFNRDAESIGGSDSRATNLLSEHPDQLALRHGGRELVTNRAEDASIAIDAGS